MQDNRLRVGMEKVAVEVYEQKNRRWDSELGREIHPGLLYYLIKSGGANELEGSEGENLNKSLASESRSGTIKVAEREGLDG